jgi:hypothetical protein
MSHPGVADAAVVAVEDHTQATELPRCVDMASAFLEFSLNIP